MPWHVGNIGKTKPQRNLVQCPRKKRRSGLLKRQKGNNIMQTPFEKCTNQGHEKQRVPNMHGLNPLLECETCGLQWAMPTRFAPNEKPITIYHTLPKNLK